MYSIRVRSVGVKSKRTKKPKRAKRARGRMGGGRGRLAGGRGRLMHGKGRLMHGKGQIGEGKKIQATYRHRPYGDRLYRPKAGGGIPKNRNPKSKPTFGTFITDFLTKPVSSILKIGRQKKGQKIPKSSKAYRGKIPLRYRRKSKLFNPKSGGHK